MDKLKNVAIILAIAVVLGLVSSSFAGSEVLERAIILGMGIDYHPDGIMLTAEVVSPGNGTEQVGTFSKTVTVVGKSAGDAIQQIALQTGKEASLGQCVLLVLGQDFYQKVNFADTINYFVHSDSFKESAILCCCVGNAGDLFAKGEALAQSVSLSLEGNLLNQAKKVGVLPVNLLDFARSMQELHCTGYLNLVQFNKSQNTDEQKPDQPQGYFSYNQMAIFRQYDYVCNLDQRQTIGFGLFSKNISGNSYVSDASGKQLTVRVTGKDVKKSRYKQGVKVDIQLFLRLARTDSAEAGGSFVAKNQRQIPSQTVTDVINQAKQMATEFLQKQMQYNFDLIGLHELYRQKYGSSDTLANTPTEQIEVYLTVSGQER